MREKMYKVFKSGYIAGFKNSHSKNHSEEYMAARFNDVWESTYKEEEPITLDEVFPLPITKPEKRGKK